ncbi:hypothetical protein HXX76_006725 [Chlamydomonas incerta]|uniref:Uncharacterized protein n=1 Tax=Chlamydomonas incerta TaxID=51695 RepID=A0A835W5F9_CHLIN|nr:hypothetical protein HXX76_006725 [Chlamydomonas incerta]|eukprot:KAG2436421.1 hypothetical protein HXX76_006725 [Chlamydomonas incerta]
MPTGLTPELAYFDSTALSSYGATPGAPLDGATWANGASGGGGADLVLTGTGCSYDDVSQPQSVRMSLFGSGCYGLSSGTTAVPAGAVTLLFVLALHSNNDTIASTLFNLNSGGTNTFTVFVSKLSAATPTRLDVGLFWPQNSTSVLLAEPVYRNWALLVIPLDTLDGVAAFSVTQFGTTDTQASPAWSPTPSAFSGAMRLGNSVFGYNQVDCSLAVALVYSRKLAPADIATLRGYYAPRFGNFGPIYPPAPPSTQPSSDQPSAHRHAAASYYTSLTGAATRRCINQPPTARGIPATAAAAAFTPAATAAATALTSAFTAAFSTALTTAASAAAPAAAALVLTAPSAVPLISGRIGQALVTVVAFSRYARGSLTAFGAEAMLTGCCRPAAAAAGASGSSGGGSGRRRREVLAPVEAVPKARRRAPTDIEQLILNAANASSHYGTKTGRKAILRVSDPALVPLAKFVARQLPATFATPKQFGAPSHYLSLRALLRDGHSKCDVYVVLATYLEYLDPGVQQKFRDFVALGKGLIVAGPPVDGAAAAAGRRRGLLTAEDLLSDTSPSISNLTNSMGGISYGSSLPGGGNATKSNATSASALNALQAVNDLLRDLKGEKALPEATRLETQYAFLQARADIDRLALSIPPDLRAKIDEYVLLAKIPSPPPRPVARPPAPPAPPPAPSPSPRTAAPPNPAPRPPVPLNGTSNSTALPPAPGGAGQSPPPRGGRQRPPLPGPTP